ncbi:uncharacterized protein BP5553_04985 [Venustampulla echinocandica]|uniref:Helicase ATP-binding domain-containing protein n=1 Tax=Venustampulla echinocandica TaxID=2656787 RepID=A0A370TPW5_9HELO|nr:uncharacterized protein BP5553_04985 [Venustampulla echinocandica]RDL37552.1 hypothetical protein BP5553_04985 [Venustampulla echinocandica]
MRRSRRSAVEILASDSPDEIDLCSYAPPRRHKKSAGTPAVEILDSTSRLASSRNSIGVEIQSRETITSGQPTTRDRTARQISPSNTDATLDVILVDHTSSVESECDADDESDEEPQFPCSRRSTTKPQTVPSEIPLSDPKSSIWVGREGTNIAVVIPSNKPRLYLGQTSVSRLNAVPSRSRGSPKRVVLVEGGRKILEGNKMPNPYQSSLRPRRARAAVSTYSDSENSFTFSNPMDVDDGPNSETVSGDTDYDDSSKSVEPPATEIDDNDISLEESDISLPPTKRQKVSISPKSKKAAAKPPKKTIAVKRRAQPAATKKPKAPKSSSTKLPVSRRKTKSGSSSQSASASDDEPPDEEEAPEEEVVNGSKPKAAVKWNDTFKYGLGFDNMLPPINTVRAAFEDLFDRSKEIGFNKYLRHLDKLGNRNLTVATMCSGTESPMLALDLLGQIRAEAENGAAFGVDHKFSAEIVPFKQAYIYRNFEPGVVFRDITELFALEGHTRAEAENKFKMKTAHGGSAIVPGDIDLLVAGTCCVDFSTLNRARKTLADGGESGDTFYAMLHYARVYRPRVIILENVSGAPWDGEKNKSDSKVGMNTELEEIGYESRSLKLDTKEYGIPHTRLRGYLIAVDTKCDRAKKIDIADRLDKWVERIAALKRPASSPAEQWLRRSDDPLLAASGGAWLSETQKATKAPKWEACKCNHHSYRHFLALGMKRTLTNWVDDGHFELPDYYNRNLKGYVERVLDTLEVAHLRNLTRGFDDRYYARILELSQNVFRVTDTIKEGIVGCLTPTGFPFLTTRGGRILGAEALSLQGLPVEQLDLCRLNQAELQNLAGNAMTSTVVGTCIVAALSSFYDFFGYKAISQQKVETVTPEVAGVNFVKKRLAAASYEKLSPTDAIAEARLTRRLCYCERDEKKKLTFQKCKVCQHTTCTSCGKSPTHQYEPMDEFLIKARKDPVEFEMRLRNSVPMRIRFTDLSSPELEKALANIRQCHGVDIDTETWKMILGCVHKALESEVFFRSVRRAECWEVQYDSPYAKLMLTISDSQVRWDLYANLPNEPLGTPLGKYLRQFSIARMIPTENDLTQGPWKLWLPKKHEFDVDLSLTGPMVPSYQDHCGLAAFTDTSVCTNIRVDIANFDPKYFDIDIRGEYEAFQSCGQAFNSLHVKKSTSGSTAPLFFFLEQHLRSGDPNDHFFVFTKDNRRLEKLEHREAIARVNKSFRLPHAHRIESAKGQKAQKFKFDDSKDNFDPLKDTKQMRVKITVDGAWADFEPITFNSRVHEDVYYRQLPKDVSQVASTSCHKQLAVFMCEAPIKGKFRRWPSDRWIELNTAKEADFTNEFGWLLERGLVLDGHHELSGQWHSIAPSQGDCACLNCAPAPPRLLWSINKKGKQFPFEEPEDASKFEQALKTRPSPISTFVSIKGGNIAVIIGVNPKTLIHRSVARLESNVFGDNMRSGIFTSWRLITDSKAAPSPQFRPLHLTSNARHKKTDQPAQFHFKLRPEQLRGLAWMEMQELENIFVETEIVEARLSSLGYRAEGRATREVNASGGVLAFDVAFGKTALVLALIAKSMPKASEHAAKTIKGAVPLKATIVLVPAHLTGQWESEVKKFMKMSRNVLVVKNILSYKSMTVAKFQAADIIIFNMNLLDHEGYNTLLSNFAGMPEIGFRESNRAKLAWRKEAAARVKSNVDRLSADPQTFVAHLRKEYAENIEESERNEAPIPSKRLTGSAYVSKNKPCDNDSASDTDSEVDIVNNKRKRGQEPKRAQNPKVPQDPKRNVYFSSIKNRKIQELFPLLEMFSFHRLVIDEYTYLKGTEATVDLVRSAKRWILSGTPALGSFSDIKKMARLIGIHLGIDDLSSMRSDDYKAAITGLTTAEHFRSYLEVPSVVWKHHRHLLCQTFLDQFVRRDEADLGTITMTTTYRIVVPPRSEWAMYQEIQQRAAAMEFDRSSKRFRGSGTDAEEQFALAIGNSHDLREALIFRAAHPRLLDDDVEFDSELRGVEDRILCLRKNDQANMEAIIKDALTKAVWLQNNQEKGVNPPNFTDWKSRVKENVYGDEDATKSLCELIDQASNQYDRDGWTSFYRIADDKDKERQHLVVKPKGKVVSGSNQHLYQSELQLRIVTTQLSRLGEYYANQRRSLRFFENLNRLRRTSLSCGKCRTKNINPKEVTLLTKCGHMICNANQCQVNTNDTCPVCKSTNHKYQRILVSDLENQSSSLPSSNFGQKLNEITTLIGNELHEEDKVLIFAQFSNILDTVKAALEHATIPFVDLSKTRDPSKTLLKFQSDGPEISKVLVLDIDDASAAGSNLTCANHVIFVSPYYVKGSGAQEKWRATMTQAIGRIRRYGQQKEVKVYHFATQNTIDVDIIEQRENSMLVQSSQRGLGTLKPRLHGQSRPLSSAVAHLLFRREDYE